MKAPLQERVRQRLKHLVDARDVPHETLGEHLGLTRSAVTRLLNDEGAGIRLHHIERLCVFFQITPAELMTEPGALIQPLVPLEAAILDVIRKMDKLRQHSLLDVLEWPAHSVPPTKRGRVPEYHLTSEELMIVSLYRGMQDADAQAGIVMQMRGFVRAKTGDHNGGGRERQ